jgi:pimeloyl-ACP methyl ester carboxylesterase
MVEGELIDNIREPDLPIGKTPEQKKFLAGIRQKYQLDSNFPADYRSPAIAKEKLENYALERFPLPLGVKKAIIKKFALEAYYYLFDEPFASPSGETVFPRQELRKRLIETLTKLRADHDKLVIVCHSMGTIIAYDCLMNCAECPVVDGLITLGSPLGVDEVQDQLIPNGDNNNAFPSAKLLGAWINVYDPLDPVASLDPRFANDYCKDGLNVVRDIEESNWGNWRHTITKYLKGPKLRASVREVLGLNN